MAKLGEESRVADGPAVGTPLVVEDHLQPRLTGFFDLVEGCAE